MYCYTLYCRLPSEKCTYVIMYSLYHCILRICINDIHDFTKNLQQEKSRISFIIFICDGCLSDCRNIPWSKNMTDIWNIYLCAKFKFEIKHFFPKCWFFNKKKFVNSSWKVCSSFVIDPIFSISREHARENDKISHIMLLKTDCWQLRICICG